MAISGYASAHGILRRGICVKPHKHNFVAYLLPHMEKTAVANLYDFNEEWNADPKTLEHVVASGNSSCRSRSALSRLLKTSSS
jgi:hypothetical protein